MDKDMTGISRIERIYTLGAYQNIKIVSEITDIPQAIILKGVGKELLTKLQLLWIERTYLNYITILNELPKEDITKEINQTLDEFITLINPKQEK